jgi:hypothetical protein
MQSTNSTSDSEVSENVSTNTNAFTSSGDSQSSATQNDTGDITPSADSSVSPADNSNATDSGPDNGSQAASGGDTDSDGFKMLDSGSWNGSSTLNYQGGQAMHFAVKNVNVLGTTITIDSNLGGSKSLLILPAQSGDMKFTCFGSEPMAWTFNISSDSDAFIVGWKLYSSWIAGDAPNG